MGYEKGDKIFENWEYERFLGEGGFGKVYLVRNKVGIPKALKVLHIDVSLKDGTRGSAKEIRGVRDVMELAASSARLVTIEDFGQTVDGLDCILMEYIPRSLEDELKQGKLAEDKAIHWFEELLKGLEILEGNSLVHRDLKPANLFVKDDVLSIGDFGSLKYTSGYSSGMSQGVGMTLEYTPPEKYQNQSVSFAGDRWAAAVIFHQMLSGTFPFTGDSPFAIMNAVNFNEPDLSLVSKHYHNFFRNCFIKNVEEREKEHSTTQDMLADFKSCFKVVKGSKKNKSRVKSKKAKLDKPIELTDVFIKSDQPEVGTVWKDSVLGMEFVWVPGGKLNNYTLAGFWMGKYEVTQAQWKKIMGSNNNPSYFAGDNRPVERVSWNDCQKFIDKLKDKSPGNKFNLPTEAQWEYAALGGPLSKGYEYSGSDNLDDVAWYNGNSGDKTHDVGTTPKGNELGIYDMSGNVWEWCQDKYSSSSSDRVGRGGSWNNDAGHCRVALRAYVGPGYAGNGLGFRLCLSRTVR